MKLVPAGFGLGDDPLQVFEVAKDEFDALPADARRRPTIDHGSHPQKSVTIGPGVSFTT